MKAFVASLATESNCFSPIETTRQSFHDAFYAAPGAHPDRPTLCSAPFIAARERSARGDFELVEGTATWAEPAGPVTREGYESLRDEILDQLSSAMPVDIVLFGLHGAMMAEGYDDCEGDLLGRARRIVGADAVIGAELDPHCHLTSAMIKTSDVLVAFKEVPHSDFSARAQELVDIAVRAAQGQITPAMSVLDCRTISPFLTTHTPGRALLAQVRALEHDPDIVDISVIHGFPAGDCHDVGTKVIVITDANPEKGRAVAETIGERIRALGENRLPAMPPPAEAVRQALAMPGQPVILADRWDNPGGGVAGDSTFLVHELLGLRDVASAVGGLWDPQAVQQCRQAGKGATMRLRFGAKGGNAAGTPVDETVNVTALCDDLVTPFQESTVSMGASAAIRLGAVDVVLTSKRVQTFHPNVFEAMGIPLAERKIVAVKSASHFQTAFAPVCAGIIFVDCGGPFPSEPARIRYKRIRRPIVPLDPPACAPMVHECE
ncbi:MAG: M81 family metallopeptidase [Roseitalea porphyridii]|uniref:M81 family metallopeptidase n=1 Tax=Roseitalea porphyridii TaxID=1852022 RepID=UPI0032D8F6F8